MKAITGGGSFLFFPAILAIGVAPIQADATNTVALWPGQLTSVAALRLDLRRDLLPVIVIASILGGVGGAVVLLHTPQGIFLNLVSLLLLTASLLFGISGPVSRLLLHRIFGAGAGFLIMSALALFGVEKIHRLNALKVLAAYLSNLCARPYFHHQRSHHLALLFCLDTFRRGRRGRGRTLPPQHERRCPPQRRCNYRLTMAAYFFWRQHRP